MIKSPTPTSHYICESNLLYIRCSDSAPSFIPLSTSSYHITYQFFVVGVQLIDFRVIKLMHTVFFNRCLQITNEKKLLYAPPPLEVK